VDGEMMSEPAGMVELEEKLKDAVMDMSEHLMRHDIAVCFNLLDFLMYHMNVLGFTKVEV
jgi:hypothetical protein